MKRFLGNTFLAFASLTLFVTGAPLAASAQTTADNTYQWQTFEDWDANRSGYVEGGEYRSYAFGMADWDNDGYLEDTEWASYTETFYDTWDLDYDSYTYYDTNGDGYIDQTEFNEFATADGGLYDAWDYDDDDLIGEDEWDQVTAYFYDNQ